MATVCATTDGMRNGLSRCIAGTFAVAATGIPSLLPVHNIPGFNRTDILLEVFGQGFENHFPGAYARSVAVPDSDRDNIPVIRTSLGHDRKGYAPDAIV